jgi:hypothetical protein
MSTCECVVLNREEGESQREWFKRWMCMFHWMQTEYYQNKLRLEENILQHELLDLITLMPDTQTQEIIDYIMSLREIRAKNRPTKG